MIIVIIVVIITITNTVFTIMILPQSPIGRVLMDCSHSKAGVRQDQGRNPRWAFNSIMVMVMVMVMVNGDGDYQHQQRG